MKYLIITILTLVITITFICIYAFLIEPNSIGITEHNVNKLFKVKNTDITFVQITDLHIKINGSFDKKIANEIIKINPDFVLFTGDIIDNNNRYNILENFLKLLPEKLKKYAILGNWEYWGNIDILKLGNLYRKYNCDLLINSTDTFYKNGNQIQIIGIDDATAGIPNLSEALGYSNLEENHILISHSPIYRNSLINNDSFRIKFMLSGHSHGGQVRIFDYTPYLPIGVGPYIKGWFKNQYPYLYVSRGLGTSIYPIRLGAEPEIAVFKIKKS